VGSGPAFQFEGAFGGDGGPATEARLNLPQDVEVDSAGVLYVADDGNVRIRAVDRQGIIRTVLGAGIGEVRHMELDPQGRLFFSAGGMIRHIDEEGNIRTDLERTNGIFFAPAGDGTLFYISFLQVWRARPGEAAVAYAGVGFLASAGDGGPATDARLGFPRGDRHRSGV